MCESIAFQKRPTARRHLARLGRSTRSFIGPDDKGLSIVLVHPQEQRRLPRFGPLPQLLRQNEIGAPISSQILKRTRRTTIFEVIESLSKVATDDATDSVHHLDVIGNGGVPVPGGGLEGRDGRNDVRVGRSAMQTT